ncbi:chromate transporter-domain-containing protein [Limtongia smithiae]|uniref:chromate transporter-domain-containing protein n=1 Tax=Limtongia smithiae TaxID=1125753 RepID=UPI0034CD2087
MRDSGRAYSSTSTLAPIVAPSSSNGQWRREQSSPGLESSWLAKAAMHLLHFLKFFKWNLKDQIVEVTKYQWHMGFSSFGGPVVQFQNFNKLFVEKYEWLSDDTYQELFAVAQALPGSASTKLLFIITILHTSLIPALVSFIYWALPGAAGMFALALGVGQIGSTLPDPVYALLSGLNAATVGVIFVAAIQLSNRSITDKLSFSLVFLGGAAGVCYTALWYFPVLMVAGGTVAVVYDLRFIQRWYARSTQKIKRRFARRRASEELEPPNSVELRSLQDDDDHVWLPEVYRNVSESASINPSRTSESGAPTVRRQPISTSTKLRASTTVQSVDYETETLPVVESTMEDEPVDASDVRAAVSDATPEIGQDQKKSYPVWLGVSVVIGFLISFVVVIVIHAVVKGLPLTFKLFANLYLAGTIIFGGGPVVIPLLRQYIVAEGWVSARDFTIGLALIQAFPGPNFNFAIYLGALTYHNGGYSSFWGAVVSFIAMYAPGMLVAGGMFTFWHKLRKYAVITSLLRGINAAAIGLVWTAIYRIWESGFLSDANPDGISLGEDPWWTAVASTAFVLGRGWSVPAPFSIFLGGLMGIIWWGVTGDS